MDPLTAGRARTVGYRTPCLGRIPTRLLDNKEGAKTNQTLLSRGCPREYSFIPIVTPLFVERALSLFDAEKPSLVKSRPMGRGKPCASYGLDFLDHRLVKSHLGKAFVHVDLGHAARLHLRPDQLDPGLELLEYLVVSPRFPARTQRGNKKIKDTLAKQWGTIFWRTWLWRETVVNETRLLSPHLAPSSLPGVRNGIPPCTKRWSTALCDSFVSTRKES